MQLCEERNHCTQYMISIPLLMHVARQYLHHIRYIETADSRSVDLQILYHVSFIPIEITDHEVRIRLILPLRRQEP